MKFLRVFFRSEPNDFVFNTYGYVHLLMILTIVLASLTIYINREGLRDKKIIKRLLITCLLLQQIILLAWYLVSGYFKITESLPLYNCRLAILSMALGELLDNKRLKEIGVYWGLVGSIIAMVFPDIDPFGYNHYTFYSFFLGHLFLFCGANYILLVEKLEINRSSLARIIKFSSFYHLLIFIVNKNLRANYCYLMEAPVFQVYLNRLPKSIYTIVFIGLFNFVIYLEHQVLIKTKNSKNKIKSLV